jgi:uncharacterized protein YjbI with pentapeptide repeats
MICSCVFEKNNSVELVNLMCIISYITAQPEFEKLQQVRVWRLKSQQAEVQSKRSEDRDRDRQSSKRMTMKIFTSCCCNFLTFVVVVVVVVTLISEQGIKTTHAFLPKTSPSSSLSLSRHNSSTQQNKPLYSIWTNWIPQTSTNDFMDVIIAGGPSSSSSKNNNMFVSKKIETTTTTTATTTKNSRPNGFLAAGAVFFTAVAISLSVLQPAYAVSGGGSDFAGQDISSQDFSNQNYKLKDFTQVLARKTNFQSSIFTGCRFQNGYLIDADFTNADLRGVSFERTNMENVILKVRYIKILIN